MCVCVCENHEMLQKSHIMFSSPMAVLYMHNVYKWKSVVLLRNVLCFDSIMNIELIEDLYVHIFYLSWTIDMCFECAGNNHGKMENQDYTFVLIENAKVRSNEEILTFLLSILFCERNVNECFTLNSVCEN